MFSKSLISTVSWCHVSWAAKIVGVEKCLLQHSMYNKGLFSMVLAAGWVVCVWIIDQQPMGLRHTTWLVRPALHLSRVWDENGPVWIYAELCHWKVELTATQLSAKAYETWVPFCLVCFVVFVLRCFVLVYLKGTWFFCEFKCYHTRQSYKQSKISENKVKIADLPHTVWIETCRARRFITQMQVTDSVQRGWHSWRG